jgi:hypothetical protein
MKAKAQRIIILFFLISLSFLSSIKAQSIVYVCCLDKSLYKININSCSAQFIGYTSQILFDIAINPQNNTMYGISCYGNMYSINMTNASCNLLGIAMNANSLTFDSYGYYYFIDNQSNLYKVNPPAMLGSNLGQLPNTITSAGDLTFYKNQLYLSSMPHSLAKLNVGNAGTSVYLGSFLFNYAALGLATVYPENQCTERIYAFVGTDIYKLDTNNLTYSTLVCSNIVPSPIYGAASFSESVSTSTV